MESTITIKSKIGNEEEKNYYRLLFLILKHFIFIIIVVYKLVYTPIAYFAFNVRAK